MEKISEVLPKSKRNNFQVKDFSYGSEVLITWEITVKNAILEFLHETSKSSLGRVSCGQIHNHLLYKVNLYFDFDIWDSGDVWTTKEDFTFVCIKDLANEGYLKLTRPTMTKSIFGFRQREVVCFHENVVFATNFELEF